MLYIAPSLLAADFSCLESEIKKVADAGAKYLHLDIMDGAFVPNITFGPELVSCIRKCTDLYFDVHLMIKRPERYIDRFVKAGADIITVHYEACENPMSVERARVLRFLYREMIDGETDTQGRVTMTDSLIARAGITKEVVFVGCGRYGEIWSAEFYEEKVAEEDAEDIAASMRRLRKKAKESRT